MRHMRQLLSQLELANFFRSVGCDRNQPMALFVHDCPPVRFPKASYAQRSSPCDSSVEVGVLVDGLQ